MNQYPSLRESRLSAGRQERLKVSNRRVPNVSKNGINGLPRGNSPIRHNGGQADVDIEALKMDRVIKEGKQDEMDDIIGSMSAIAEVLESGKEQDIFLVLFETQQILQYCREFAIQTLVPIICKNVMNWSYSLKVSAGETLGAVLGDDIPTDVAKELSSTAFKVLSHPCDPSICEKWGEILVATLPNVPWTATKLDEVIDLLENQHGGSGNPLSRQLTARILGSLASCSSDDGLKRRIMSRAILITKDKNPEVRGMIAESLSFIGASIHVSIVEKELWPCLFSLLNDKDARIHAASLRTLSFIAAAHRGKNVKSKLFKDLVPSVFLQECAKIRRDASEDQRDVDEDKYLVLEINAEIFGELLYSSHEHFPDDAGRREAYKAFMAMATSNGPVVRKYCAHNIPAVSLCLSNKYGLEISALVEFLSRDADDETRWMLAAGIHQTVRILARDSTMENLFKAVLALLMDSTCIVRMKTIEHFEELIAELSKHSGYGSAQKLTPLFQNLQLLAEGNWRTQELLAKQLTLAVPLVPPSSLKMDVLPLLYRMTEESSYMVRKAAMAAVATSIRYIPDITERDGVMRGFRQDWARGSVFWMRIAFIDAGDIAVGIYSRCLFRDTFGSELLRLANDLVPNVRLRTALLLPKIASACNLMEEFHVALGSLKRDEDVDVRDAVQGIDNRIGEALERGHEKFEEDMKLEDEEQELYSRHLQKQREAQKKKNAGKRRPSILLGKAAKGIHAGKSRAFPQSVSQLSEPERDLEVSGEDDQRLGQVVRSPGKAVTSPQASKASEIRSPTFKAQESFSKSEKKKKSKSPSPRWSGSTVYGETSNGLGSRSFKGFGSSNDRSPEKKSKSPSHKKPGSTIYGENSGGGLGSRSFKGFGPLINDRSPEKRTKTPSPKTPGPSIYGESGGMLGSRSFKGLVPLLSPRSNTQQNKASKAKRPSS